MKEIEVKIPLTEKEYHSILFGIDHTWFPEKEHAIISGADLYYDTNGRGTLRTRIENGKSSITVKGEKQVDPVTKTTSREEVEIPIGKGSLEKWQQGLKILGFTPVATVSKIRRMFDYKDTTICLDKVDGLGLFIEIEVVTEEGIIERGRALAKIDAVRKEFGLENHVAEERGYLDMIMEKQ